MKKTDHSYWDRSREVTRSNARLGCALTILAAQRIGSEGVFLAIDFVPYFELWFFVSPNFRLTTPFCFRPGKEICARVFSKNEAEDNSTGALIMIFVISSKFVIAQLFCQLKHRSTSKPSFRSRVPRWPQLVNNFFLKNNIWLIDFTEKRKESHPPKKTKTKTTTTTNKTKQHKNNNNQKNNQTNQKQTNKQNPPLPSPPPTNKQKT